MPEYQLPYAKPQESQGQEADLPKKAEQLGKVVRPAPPDENAHWWDEISHEVLDSVEDDVAWLHDEILGGTRAPFSARTSEDQKLAYYRSKFFTEDGKPNEAGRREELARLGVRGFSQVLASLLDDAEPFKIEPGNFYETGQPGAEAMNGEGNGES